MSDYAHARHAGNAGDVLKHVALVAALDALLTDPSPLLYVESHAADGLFPLGAVGEWGAGISRLWPAAEPGQSPSQPPALPRPQAPAAGSALLSRYASLVQRHSRPGAQRPERYPGSPLFAQALLRPQDRMLFHDVDARAVKLLSFALDGDARARVIEGDGLDALPAAVAQGRALALIDPPYSQKEEWTLAARALGESRSRAPGASFLLWYPIKALTRPRALFAELLRSGVHGCAVELYWTPLRLQRDRLAGSGVLFVGVPDAAVSALCAALPALGQALMTHGEWSAQQIGF